MKHTIKNKKDGKRIILEIVLVILTIFMLVPIYYLVVTTFKTPEQATANPMGLPTSINFKAYVDAWKLMEYPRVFKNNLIITGTAVFGVVMLSAMAAYPIARRRHKLNKIVFFIFLTGIMVPYQMAVIPIYKLMISLKLMNKLAGVILIDIFINVPFAVFLFRGFISTIPIELEEAASIDGCGIFKVFWRVTFPLLKPVIATVIILNSLNIWNDFLTPLLFLQSREKDVILQEVYRNIGQFSIDWTSFFPMMVLGVAPLVIFYVFMQKYIIKGIASGAVKG
ncbi:sugar ABC transporter permease [Vallitalea longa]|uniref:Sugar ABC transporter permease n=1 Tax=Vallitalea longa TaxID=2936439 RepID=A0A9W5YFX8_9FIRM|nr:carbohydrate ABC transporter permease [Vallitalea longa]GKX31583.1 sugar ABC transporter permease [Vallitalea longa]